MPIPVTCPGCSAKLNAPDAAAGKMLTCPKCRVAVPVPARASAAPAFEVVEDEPPAPPQPAAPESSDLTERSRREKGDEAGRGEPDARPRREARDTGGGRADRRPRNAENTGEDRGEGDERPRRQRPRDAEDDTGDRPRKSILPLVLVGVFAVLLAGGAVVAGAVYWFVTNADALGDKPITGVPIAPPPTFDQWNWFNRAESGFRVQFPAGLGSPTEDWYSGGLYANRDSLHRQVPAARRADSYSVQRLENNNGSDPAEKHSFIVSYEFMLIVVAFVPDAPLARRESAVDAVVASLHIPTDLKEGAPKAVTWGRKPARETVHSAEPGSTGGRRVVVRRLVTESAGYVGLVRDVGKLKPEDYATFFDSLELSAPVPYKEPAKPTLPAAPAGWVPYKDTHTHQRFSANVPPGGVPTVRGGRLAFLDEVDKQLIVGGDYSELSFPDSKMTLSVRVLNFSTAAGGRDELLVKYVRRMTGPLPEGAKTEKRTWATLAAVEEASEADGTAEVRRYAVGHSVGFVVTLRGPRGAAFDALKATQFDHFLPNRDATHVPPDGKLQGWPWFTSADAMYRVSVPTPAVKTDDLDKVMEGAKLTGEFHTVTKDGLVFHVGHVRYPAGATNDDRRSAREALATALGRPGATGLPKPVNFPAVPGRQLAWQDYQRRGTGEQPGFRVRFHEFDGGVHVVSVHGVGVFTATDANVFFQSFVLLY